MPPAEKVRHILSFGGGVNTVALMLLLIQEDAPLDEVLFADTGGEVPETYQYLDIVQEYLAGHGIPFKTVKKLVNGTDLYGTSYRRMVIPSVMWRWSTRDFKVKPIYSYYRTLNCQINQYVGIAYDEIHRMKDSPEPFVRNIYPLIDRKLTREGCIEVIQHAGLPVPVKSGCFFCPFNSATRWKWLHEEHPDLFEKAVALEENSKHFPKQRLTDQVYRERGEVTLREFGEALRNNMAAIEAETEQDACGAECMV